jgi:hypothetical protein
MGTTGVAAGRLHVVYYCVALRGVHASETGSEPVSYLPPISRSDAAAGGVVPGGPAGEATGERPEE